MKSGSRLERILTAGKFAVTGELGPPKNADPAIVREKARILKGHVDAVNITDCQTAIVRMSSIAAGLIVLSEGVEPVIQMTCRDRNRIGMQSDILGAAALGLKNLLCLTGDHQKFGNHPGAKGVFDMDSIQLLGMVKDMRDDKKFQCGEVIKNNEPKLFLGAAANPFAEPFEYRAPRLGKKVANGADFIQTQIVYNVEKFAKFMEMVRDLGLHEKVYILAGVTPPKSLGMARYMKKFVPGMDVTDEVIQRMKDAKDKEDEGINICVDVINQVKEIKGVAGVHIMAIEWESAVPEIVSRAKLATRPVLDDDSKPAALPREVITIATTPAVSGERPDDILASAKAEAAKIIAAAKEQAQTGSGTIEIDDAGEHTMNEKERQMALESVKTGLDSLKKAFGLSDDQFEALAKFAGAEAILSRQPVVSTPSTPPVAPPVKPTPTPPPSDKAQQAAKETKKAEEEKKAQEAKAAQEAQKAAEEKKAQEDKKAADAKAAEQARKTQEAKPKEESKKAPAAKTKAAAAGSITAAELKVETSTLAQRASRIPEDNYKITYSGKLREIKLGNGDNTITVGGTATMPFQLFEGAMPRKPLFAMDVLDINPDEWPKTLTRHFDGVLNDPVAWAKKCVNEYNADAICISLISTDPNGMNRPASEAAKVAADVVKNIDVPIIVWGCGNADKDTETLREVTAMIGDKKVCLAPLGDVNYRSLGATGMAFQHPMVASSPIDVNLAKQLNILLENLGVSLESVLIDPSIGALGYGIEYSYSVMERIRLAALTQKDEKLQVPFI
ncbi:MAG: acetyl-CoA decarbonylase/synthase complex subunit delta, partial [Proteobacteria bacterium]|nr:acetyl-CoA decarbonylase/synthase complex subunit delta [Pseudomonadota bacterium]